MISEAYARLLGQSKSYLDLIDQLLPVAKRHNYTFWDDSQYREWVGSDDFSILENNFIVASELIDKAHLAAVTSLIRTRRWADAICQAYYAPNYLAWASAFRGLLESSGDIFDGLGVVGAYIAKNHTLIRACIKGRVLTSSCDGETVDLVPDFRELEHKLDHYVHATWMRRSKDSDKVFVAKSNVEYVKTLAPVIPGVENLYHQLCAVVHPSIASIEWTYHRGDKLQIKEDDIGAIDAVTRQFPEAIPTALQFSCRTALLILRALHKFDVHPHLPMVKHVPWPKDIEDALRSFSSRK